MPAISRPNSAFFLTLSLAVALQAQATLVTAWIKDRNLDGIADQVHLRFSQVPTQLPFLVAAAWSEDTTEYREASGAQITYAPGDSTRVIADFPDSVFAFGVTAVSREGAAWVRLPPQGGLPAQEQRLQDSIPPLLIEAAFHADLSGRGLDSLKVRVSEPLKTMSNFASFLRYSSSCADTGLGSIIDLAVNPMADWEGTRYVAVTARKTGSPQVGGCVGLNGDGNLTDLPNNFANERKIPLRAPGPVPVRRISTGVPVRDQGIRVRADGRRFAPPRPGYALRPGNLITFKGDPPQEGPSHDHSLGHPEP